MSNLADYFSLIRMNARILFGHSMTYDIVTPRVPPLSLPTPPPARALLVGYSGGSGSTARVLDIGEAQVNGTNWDQAVHDAIARLNRSLGERVGTTLGNVHVGNTFIAS